MNLNRLDLAICALETRYFPFSVRLELRVAREFIDARQNGEIVYIDQCEVAPEDDVDWKECAESLQDRVTYRLQKGTWPKRQFQKDWCYVCDDHELSDEHGFEHCELCLGWCHIRCHVHRICGPNYNYDDKQICESCFDHYGTYYTYHNYIDTDGDDDSLKETRWKSIDARIEFMNSVTKKIVSTIASPRIRRERHLLRDYSTLETTIKNVFKTMAVELLPAYNDVEEVYYKHYFDFILAKVQSPAAVLASKYPNAIYFKDNSLYRIDAFFREYCAGEVESGTMDATLEAVFRVNCFNFGRDLCLWYPDRYHEYLG